MHRTLRVLLVAGGTMLAASAAAQITFYEHDNFHGRVLATSRPIVNFDPIGFNDRASSVVVERGRWEVCEHAHFEGRCIVLRPGNYPSLASMGMNDRISSVRPAYREVQYENEAPPPAPVPLYEYRQRPDERLFVANVTSVRAVVGPPEQRCWVERQQVAAPAPNVPGAIVGGIIGGVLGHQIGSGRGRDVATVGGAVAGVVIGANAGGGSTSPSTQDVQRCTSVPSSAAPQYWDVSYEFGGIEHHVQMSAPPGPTITVNRDGEPRG